MSRSASDGTLGESHRSLRSPFPLLYTGCEFHAVTLTLCTMRPCSPGRFFAANELKAMLAYIVVNYDIKVDGDGARPPNVYFANTVLPNQRGKIMFRKRQAASA